MKEYIIIALCIVILFLLQLVMEDRMKKFDKNKIVFWKSIFGIIFFTMITINSNIFSSSGDFRLVFIA
ncbi:MAG: hypothetical protein ABJA35_12260, partial [Parafilimonas sp.]